MIGVFSDRRTCMTDTAGRITITYSVTFWYVQWIRVSESLRTWKARTPSNRYETVSSSRRPFARDAHVNQRRGCLIVE